MLQSTALHLLDNFSSARVLVLGDVMLDRFVYGTVDRISPEAPIPVVGVERTVDVPGGAANVARNIASLGGRCTLLGIVGVDPNAALLQRQLEAWQGVNACLIPDAARPTTLKCRYVADGQQIMRADWERSEELSPEIASSLLAQFAQSVHHADVVVLSDYAKGVLSDFVIQKAIALAHHAGKPTIVDPKSSRFSRYAGANLLTPNRLELERACGFACLRDDDVVRGARHWLETHVCKEMVVTRGKDGLSVIRSDGSAVHLSTEARQVYDVSGAGDTVIATLALSIASAGGIEAAASLANMAAGVVVGRLGTATVTPGEIMASVPLFGRHADPLKVYSVENAMPLIREWRDRGLKVAFTNGCFDLLHPGHLSLLDQARRTADRLIVGLNADASIRRLKGHGRPIQGQVARAAVLAAVRCVDAVIIFTDDTPAGLIDALKPDVLVKGADYSVETVVGADEVIKRGGRVVLAQFVDGHSTTETVKRVAHAEFDRA